MRFMDEIHLAARDAARRRHEYFHDPNSHATCEEACAIVGMQLGEECGLGDLLEVGLTPSFWLQPRAHYPRGFFDDRRVPYWARMAFSGERMIIVEAEHALVSTFTTPEGRLVQVKPRFPGIPTHLRVSLSELHFCWGDLEDPLWKWHDPRDSIRLACRNSGETQEARQARRYRLCVEAGLTMPSNDYAAMPRGIGKVADAEGISRQALVKDLKAHINRINSRN
jgi:hypothetical protein